MKRAKETKSGHLTDGGPLLLTPTKEGSRKGAIATNRAYAERKNPQKAVTLNWKRGG
jgi:hypothetical protein